MKELKDFITKLREQRDELSSKNRYCYEHKFTYEAAALTTKIGIINTIMYELEAVTEGNKKGIDAKFSFAT